jgi:transcriptional regulator with XRE-family HTH domain
MRSLPRATSRRRAFPTPNTRRLLRDLHRISIEDLGGFLDVDSDTLSAWENGEPDRKDERVDNYRAALDWLKRSIGTLKPEWTSTTWTLLLLRDMGLDPASSQARRAVSLVRDNSKWDEGGQDYFDGEVEPCINGKAVALGAHFGENVDGIVERLLGEQLGDGGWNCEAEPGSTRPSFNTTISVLEGMLEYERANAAAANVTGARLRGQEYLLERRMFRRLSTGEVVDPTWTRFSFPTGWHYDVLWGLDYLRSAGVEPDERCAEAIDLLEGRRTPTEDGPWRTPIPVGSTSTWTKATASRVVGTPYVPCGCSPGTGAPPNRAFRDAGVGPGCANVHQFGTAGALARLSEALPSGLSR